jgi:hypothetical protein
MKISRLGALPLLLALPGLALTGGLLSSAAAAEEVAPTSATAKLSATTASVTQKVTLSGKVLPADAGYAVTVQTNSASGWRTVGRTTTGAGGAYSVTVPTRWYNRHVFRVRATNPDADPGCQDGTGPGTEVPCVPKPPTAVTSPQAAVTVKPSYNPGGSASAHAFLAGDDRIRWNGCKPITYKVRVKGGYDGSLKHIKQAVRMVGQATGYPFAYKGKTKVVAFGGAGNDAYDKSVDFTISWATPKQVPQLAGNVVGLGGPAWIWWGDAGEFVVGRVALDASQKNQLLKGFKKGNRSSWGTVMVHEIGHAIGLGHVGDRKQIMYPAALPGLLRLGAGDLRGSQKLGLAQGCVQRPAFRGVPERGSFAVPDTLHGLADGLADEH